MSSDTEQLGLLGPSEKLYERNIESEAADSAGLVEKGKGKGDIPACLVFDSRCRLICNFWASVSKAFMPNATYFNQIQRQNSYNQIQYCSCTEIIRPVSKLNASIDVCVVK